MSIFIKELKNTSNNSILIKKIRLYYEGLRVKEILLIGGVTFIGLIFNPNKFVPDIFLDWIFIMLSSYTLLGHAFTANDWSGYHYDKNDINKMNRPLVKGEMNLSEIKILSLTLLLISMLLSVMVSYLSLFIVAGIAVLNYLYSGRKIFLKSVPVVSTVIHGLGASLGFLLGYTYSGNIDSTGIFFAFYFGILYAAGHLNHEIMDNDSDKKSGIPTNATILGKRNSFIGSFILFSISYFYIILLVILDILPFTLIFGVVVSYLLYTYFFASTFRRSTFDYNAMIWFRQKYRIIFLLWGIFMSLIIVFNK